MHQQPSMIGTNRAHDGRTRIAAPLAMPTAKGDQQLASHRTRCRTRTDVPAPAPGFFQRTASPQSAPSMSGTNTASERIRTDITIK